jgi:hypothetical protein
LEFELSLARRDVVRVHQAAGEQDVDVGWIHAVDDGVDQQLGPVLVRLVAVDALLVVIDVLRLVVGRRAGAGGHHLLVDFRAVTREHDLTEGALRWSPLELAVVLRDALDVASEARHRRRALDDQCQVPLVEDDLLELLP